MGPEDLSFLNTDLGGMEDPGSGGVIEAIRRMFGSGAQAGVPAPVVPPPAPLPVVAPNAGIGYPGGSPPPDLSGGMGYPGGSPPADVPSLGASLTGPIPMPQARPTGTVPMPTPAPAQATPAAAGPANFLNALKGVVAPPRPDVVKPTSPHIVGPKGTVQGGQLFQLLEQLNAQQQPAGGLKLPPTLGQALGGR